MIAAARRFVPVFILFVATISIIPADVFSDLDENIDTPRFGTLLEDTLKSAGTMEDLDRLVQDYLPRLSDENLRLQLLLEAGGRYELAHRYDRAKRMYLRARQIAPSSTEIAIALAGVLLEEGSPDEVIIILSNAIHGAESRSLQRRAAFLRSRAYHLNGNTDQAIMHLRSLTAVDQPFDEAHGETVEVESYALLAELAIQTDRQGLYDEVLDRMKRLFPDAPETTLAGTDSPDRITFYPSPARIAAGIGPISWEPVAVETETIEVDQEARNVQENQNGGDVTDEPVSDSESESESDSERPRAAGIQTGSFRDPENAEYMALDIENFGFQAHVREVQVNGNTFYMVIVPIPDDAENPQNLVVALKERGVEGFLVFD